MKKVLSILAAVSPFALFAEGESVNHFDLSSAATAASEMSTSFSTFVTTNVVPAALTIIGCLVALWALLKLPKWVGLGRK